MISFSHLSLFSFLSLFFSGLCTLCCEMKNVSSGKLVSIRVSETIRRRETLAILMYGAVSKWWQHICQYAYCESVASWLHLLVYLTAASFGSLFFFGLVWLGSCHLLSLVRRVVAVVAAGSLLAPITADELHCLLAC